MERLTAWGNTLIAQSAAAGALPSLYAATDPAVAGGRCYGPDRLFAMRGHPKQVSFVRRPGTRRGPAPVGRLRGAHRRPVRRPRHRGLSYAAFSRMCTPQAEPSPMTWVRPTLAPGI